MSPFFLPMSYNKIGDNLLIGRMVSNFAHLTTLKVSHYHMPIVKMSDIC